LEKQLSFFDIFLNGSEKEDDGENKIWDVENEKQTKAKESSMEESKSDDHSENLLSLFKNSEN